MEFHGIPWNAMEFMEFHVVSIEFHGMPCTYMEFHVMPWNSIDCPWSSMEFLGELIWSSMECYGVPWSIDEVRYSFPAFCMRIHRNSLIKQLIKLLTSCSSPHFLLERKIEHILDIFKSINRATKLKLLTLKPSQRKKWFC